MLFAIQDIINHSRDVRLQCGQTIPKLHHKRQWEENESYLRKKAQEFAVDQTKESLQNYAHAILLAANFLKANSDHTKSRLKFLSQHLEELHKQAVTLLPQASLELPSEINELELSEKKRQLEEIKTNFKNKLNDLAYITLDDEQPTAATIAFLNSPEFLALKNYKAKVLDKDKRDHHFFGMNFKVKKKHQGLAVLIEAFENQKTLDGINNVMKTFYNTKNDSKSLYDFLNKAQGFFTWVAQDFFFWLFEAKTTTVGLIDSLDGVLQALNDSDEETELAVFSNINPT